MNHHLQKNPSTWTSKKIQINPWDIFCDNFNDRIHQSSGWRRWRWRTIRWLPDHRTHRSWSSGTRRWHWRRILNYHGLRIRCWNSGWQRWRLRHRRWGRRIRSWSFARRRWRWKSWRRSGGRRSRRRNRRGSRPGGRCRNRLSHLGGSYLFHDDRHRPTAGSGQLGLLLKLEFI